MSGNIILEETISQVREIMKEELEEIIVERAVLGLFFSGVKLNTGHGGLCYTPFKEIPQAVCCPSSAKAMPLSGQLSGRKATDYLADIFGANILKKTLGISVLNALSTLCWERVENQDYELIYGADAFDELTFSKEDNIVVIGALAPILRRLRTEKIDFHVLEMDPATLKPYEMPFYAPADQAELYLPQADCAVITGVTLLNDTLPDLLAMAKAGAEILVTGPTASVLPDALFRRGVTMLGGIVVTKADELLDVISEGGSGYHFFGKSAKRTVIRRKKESGRKVDECGSKGVENC
jgi:uncharacterized protein (DUF4213/DUF364 family)